MAKRFTDSEKWTDPWFAELSPSFKLAWQYMLDRCDAAGVIDLSPRIATALIGDAVEWEAFIEACEKRIVRLENGKLWLTGFIAYQYGELKSGYNPHKAAVRVVEKYRLPVAVDGVLTEFKLGATLREASLKLLDKDQDKDQAKAKKRKKVVAEPEGFAEFYEAYPRKEGRPDAAKAYADAVASIEGRDGPGGDDPVAYLLDRAKAYADSDVGKGDKQFIKQPGPWLRDSRFDADESCWVRGAPRGQPPPKARGQVATENFITRQKQKQHGQSGMRLLGSEPDLRGVRSPSG